MHQWGCSSAGRAPALQAGGQEFDSPHLHQPDKKSGNLFFENYIEEETKEKTIHQEKIFLTYWRKLKKAKKVKVKT